MAPVQCPKCGKYGPPYKNGRCPNCGKPMEQPHPDIAEFADKDTRPDDPEETAAVRQPPNDPVSNVVEDARLEFKYPEQKAGKHGVVPFRFTNLGDIPIRELSLTADCKAFADCREPLIVFQDLKLDLATNAATETRDCEFSITTEDGPYAFKIAGSYVDARDTVLAFKSSFSLLVKSPDKSSGGREKKMDIIVEDGSAIMAEKISRDAVGRIIIRDGSAADLGRIVQPPETAAGNWIKTRLEVDFDKTKMLRDWQQSRNAKPAAERRPARRKVKSPQALLTAKNSREQKRTFIWTGRKCRIGNGMDRDLADLVCILLPNTDKNKEANELISRQHCCLDIGPRKVSIEDRDSTNGTFVNGRRLSGKRALENGQVIGLANRMFLRYHDFRDLNAIPEARKAFRNCRTLFDCNRALSSVDWASKRDKARLESFLLRRLDAFKNEVEYLFLLKSATLGSSRTAAVLIENDTVSDEHARIYWVDGHYYIEDLDSEKGTSVNGRELEPNRMSPLEHPAKIELGDVRLEFRIPDV